MDTGAQLIVLLCALKDPSPWDGVATFGMDFPISLSPNLYNPTEAYPEP